MTTELIIKMIIIVVRGFSHSSLSNNVDFLSVTCVKKTRHGLKTYPICPSMPTNGPKLILVTDLVKFVTAVARLGKPDLLG